MRVLFEIAENSDAVVSLRLLKAGSAYALLSCGLDKKVRTFSRVLGSYGVLLQSRDRGWRFPYDPSQVRQAQLQEAQARRGRLLAAAGEEKLQDTGGAVAAAKGVTGTKPGLGKAQQRELKDEFQDEVDLSGQPGLLDESLMGGKKGHSSGYAKKKGHEPLWKITAGQLANQTGEGGIPTREDFQILYDQMSRDGGGPGASQDRVENRLLRKAHMKHSQRMRERSHALSVDEAAAAERLARAMGAMGGDDFGMYARMAQTLNPTGRPLLEEDDGGFESATPNHGFYGDGGGMIDDAGTPDSYG